MEGLLCVPPDRNNFLGRGGWKNRYVKLKSTTLPPLTSWSFASIHSASTASSPIGNNTGPGGAVRGAPQNNNEGNGHEGKSGTDETWVLSVYKQKHDADPVISFPIDAIASCYVGDIAQRKGFGSISKSTANTIQPTLVVHIKPEYIVRNSRRKSHVERLSPVFGTEGSEAVSKLLFRPASRTAPSLAVWAQTIQSHLSPDQSEPLSAAQNGFNVSRTSTGIETVPESPLDINTQSDNNLGLYESSPTSETSPITPENIKRMTYRAGSPHPSVTASIDSDIRSRHNFRAVSPHPSITQSIDHESISSNQKSVSQEMESVDTSSEAHGTSSTTSSVSKRETILDRAFNMNYLPTTPSPSASPQSNSVARFEALISDSNPAMYDSSYHYMPDRSVMPASFFDDDPPSFTASLPKSSCEASTIGESDSRRNTHRPETSLDELKAALKDMEENK